MKKKCTGPCKETKDLEMFTPQKRGKFGRHSRCKKCMAAYTKEYTKTHKKERAAYNKQYKLDNKEEISAYNTAYLKIYYQKNKTKIIKTTSARTVERSKEDIGFRLGRNLRRRLNHALKTPTRKHKSTMILLGCSIKELLKHLESKFVEGMTWDNYGPTWHVDHVNPLAAYDLTNHKQLEQAAHYTNLQPLFAKDNLRKGDKR